MTRGQLGLIWHDMGTLIYKIKEAHPDNTHRSELFSPYPAFFELGQLTSFFLPANQRWSHRHLIPAEPAYSACLGISYCT